jgi:hypothetical protein
MPNTTARTMLIIGSAILASMLALTACNPSEQTAAPEDPAEQTPVEKIPQAQWKMSAHATGGLGKLSRDEKRRLKAQKPRVRRFVRDIYAALFLEPESMEAVLARNFTQRAGRALIRSGAGFRPSAESIRTLARKATIGIQARTASLAAAKVKVRAKAMTDEAVVKLRHQSTLWMQRKNGRWRVIGFRVDQERAA